MEPHPRIAESAVPKAILDKEYVREFCPDLGASMAQALTRAYAPRLLAVT